MRVASKTKAELIKEIDELRAQLKETEKKLSAISEGQAAVGQMLEVERFDGSRAFVINSASPVRNDRGRIIGSVGAIQDITKLRKAEEALRESEERYRSLVESSPDGIAVHTEDRYTYINPAGAKLFGAKSPHEVIGRKVLDFVHPDYRERVEGRIRAILDQGARTALFESKILCMNGQIADVEATGSAIVYEGKPASQVIFRDIAERKRAEEALRTSLERYRSYIEVTGQLGWTTNADGEVVEDIPSFRKFTGQTDEEVKRWGWSKALHPDDFERTAQIWKQAVESKSNYEVEYRLRRHDGIYRYFLARGTPVFEENGSVREWVGTCIDITERKRIEEVLRKSRDGLEIRVQERTKEVREQAKVLDSFFKFSITPFVILDKNFNFIRVNEAYAKAGHREVSEFPGHNHFEFYPSEAKAKFEQVVQTKKPFVATARPFSFPDHPEWEISYWDWTLTPILDDTGEVEYLVFSLEDVTKHKRAEETIIQERKRFYDVLEMLPAYLVLLTPDYHVPFANRLFRERFGESHGNRCFEYLFGRDEPCEICETYTVLKTVAPHHWEWTGPDGHIYDVFDFPFTETDGTTLILEMGIDITERKRAEEALRESENRLRVLSSQLLTAQETERKRIALDLHDSIGQMLTAIKFKAENLLQEKGKTGEQRKSLEAVISLIKETIEEVRRMQMDLHPSTLDDLGVVATLGWFCREYQKIYSRIHIDKEIAIQENDVSAPLKVVLYRLTQEAMNNIAKHSQADLIHLSLRRQQNRIEWTIEDNGMGFDLETILSPEGSKRGMGLSSMRERAGLSGGTFVIESTRGKGTTIRASWPL